MGEEAEGVVVLHLHMEEVEEEPQRPYREVEAGQVGMERRAVVGKEVHRSQTEEAVEQSRKVGVAGARAAGKGSGGSLAWEIRQEELVEGGLDSAGCSSADLGPHAAHH